LLSDRGEFVTARELLAKAIKLDNDPISQGVVNFRLGYCAWKLGANDEAERYLRVARDQLRVQHPLDGEAAYILGKIYQDK
ncbi:tetratricopeptide repeat protein, partial [Salmonella sp. SAL4432]|uniref:tetratricopeptide repeat protein n=1 Tax=Salmonella sp. SAL4432 TaxID=3159887 RepID=UPI003978B593